MGSSPTGLMRSCYWDTDTEGQPQEDRETKEVDVEGKRLVPAALANYAQLWPWPSVMTKEIINGYNFFLPSNFFEIGSIL